ncbi:MAG: MFS transporter [Minwuiales bacterium]|nr:MFS transporter [Minwuiales bacterium]
MTAPDQAGIGGSSLSVSARLAWFYGALFLSVGVHMPYFPLFLQSRGLDAVQIGFLLGAARWAQMVTSPWIARVADRRRERKRPLILLAVASMAAFALYGLGHGFAAMLLPAILTAILFPPLMPLGDNLTMMAAYARKLDYGRIRLWGSVTFIAASFGGGLLLEGRDPTLIWIMILGCLGLTALSTLTLPDMRPAASGGAGISMWRLLRNRVYLLFLFSAGANMAGHTVLYAFGTLHWQAAGLSGGQIGWLWAEGVIVEIGLFAISGTLIARFGPARLLQLACLAGVLRWTIMGLSTDFWVLVASQVLHGVTFAVAHLAAMHFLTRSAPPGLSATTQSLYTAIGSGAAMGVGLIVSGYLYDWFGGGAFFFMAALCLAGTAGAVLLARRWDGEALRL